MATSCRRAISLEEWTAEAEEKSEHGKEKTLCTSLKLPRRRFLPSRLRKIAAKGIDKCCRERGRGNGARDLDIVYRAFNLIRHKKNLYLTFQFDLFSHKGTMYDRWNYV